MAGITMLRIYNSLADVTSTSVLSLGLLSISINVMGESGSMFKTGNMNSLITTVVVLDGLRSGALALICIILLKMMYY